MEIVHEFKNLTGLRDLVFKIIIRIVFRDAARQVYGKKLKMQQTKVLLAGVELRRG